MHPLAVVVTHRYGNQVLSAFSLLFAGPIDRKGRMLFRLFDYYSAGTLRLWMA